jgi:hypothetical protein
MRLKIILFIKQYVLFLIKIFDGKGYKTILIKSAEVKVLGQTSGEWVSLCKYSFSGSNRPYIEIKSNGTKAVADAVLLVSSP